MSRRVRWVGAPRRCESPFASAGSRPRGSRRHGRRLDDRDVATRKISDQLGHSKMSMTQDRYLGRKLTDHETADVLERLMGFRQRGHRKVTKSVP